MMTSAARHGGEHTAAPPQASTSPLLPDTGRDASVDLAAVTTPRELIAALRMLHVRAGRPSYRQLEALTRDFRHPLHPLRRSTVADVLGGRSRMPSKAFLRAFLKACQVHASEADAWETAWERVELQRTVPAQHGHTTQSRLDRTDSERMPRSAAARQPAQTAGELVYIPHHSGASQQLLPDSPARGFWASLTGEERHDFSVAATTKIYSAGAVLWQEGEVAGHLLVIVSGFVRVSVVREGHERVIGTRGPGDIIGERAALLLRQRSEGVVALDAVRTLRMSTQQFAAFLNDHPRVVAVLERELYERLTESAGTTDITVPPELGGAHHAPARSAMPNASQASSLTAAVHAPAHVPAPSTGPPSWAWQMCSIMSVDIAGFSAPHRNDDDRLAVRQVMYQLLREAFTGSGVPWEDCHREDRGDGAMIIVPPELPTRLVVDPLLADLTAGLRRHNRRSSDAVRIQLRVALHVGPVTHDDEGVAGSAVIHAARLLDAPILKEWLAKTRSDLGFIVSDFVYQNVIAHAPGHVVPASYTQVSCSVKESEISAWMHLSSATAADAWTTARGHEFTAREAEVVGLATTGFSNDQIAEHLTMPIQEVRQLLQTARNKLAHGNTSVPPGTDLSATAFTLALLDERLNPAP